MIKKIQFIFISFFLSVHVFSQGKNPEIAVKLDTISESIETDSLQYEIIIFDAAYQSYLVSRAKPIDFYSLSYYENWNFQYVIAWNEHYASANQVDIVDCYIDYFPDTDYGLEVNYKLYNYFLFVEEKYQIKLIERY